MAANAFGSADNEGGNNVVIAHELLHTFGATDKYDPADNMPRHPDGFAEPDARPLFPQRLAEIIMNNAVGKALEGTHIDAQ